MHDLNHINFEGIDIETETFLDIERAVGLMDGPTTTRMAGMVPEHTTGDHLPEGMIFGCLTDEEFFSFSAAYEETMALLSHAERDAHSSHRHYAITLNGAPLMTIPEERLADEQYMPQAQRLEHGVTHCRLDSAMNLERQTEAGFVYTGSSTLDDTLTLIGFVSPTLHKSHYLEVASAVA